MAGCEQSKTYAAMKLKRTGDGTFETEFEARGLSVRRGDRFAPVSRLQRWGLEEAMMATDKRQAMLNILNRTHDLKLTVKEACAPSNTYESMSPEAQTLLPELRRLIVWNGRSEHAKGASPADVVAAAINREGRMRVRSGEKVPIATVLGPATDTAKSRARPAYHMMSRSNPKGAHPDAKPVLEAIRSAMSRVVAPLMHVSPAQAATVIDAYSPNQTALGDGVFAPQRAHVREPPPNKRRKTTQKEAAALSSKRVDEMLGVELRTERVRERRDEQGTKTHRQTSLTSFINRRPE